MSADGPGRSKSLLSYFPRSRTPSDSVSLTPEDSSPMESNVSSDLSSEAAVAECQDDRLVLEPFQPRNITFPSCKFGVQSRSFQVSLFDKWKWLDWDDKQNSVYCHPCRMAVRLKFTLSKKAEPAFSEVGFRNWKDAVRCFRKHEASHSHRDASLKWLHYSRSQSVASQLSSQVCHDQAIAKECLLKIITTLSFLAHQGLAIRGHDETQGNFIQLLQLRSADSPDLCRWLKRRDNWLSHDIQNEILEIMAHSVLRKILDSVKINTYYSIIVDEATDVSFKEQVSICLRYLSNDTNQTHEDFVGMYETGSTTAETLTGLIKDALCRFGLDLRNCRGQAYDGASNMSGRLSGVQARISHDYPKAIYIHCFCHSLNLAVQDSSRHIQIVRHTLDVTHELSNLIHFSPKRQALLERMQHDFGNESTRSLRPLCPTRWTLKHKTFQSVLVNYEPLLDHISNGSDGSSCLEIRSKAGGIYRSLQTFDYLFGIMLSERFFGVTDSLSSSLQGKNVTTFNGKKAAEIVSKKLLSLRTDTEFDLFWANTTTRAQELQLSEPVLPRVRRQPRRLGAGSDPHQFSSPKEYYKRAYFEFADTLNGELDKRFSQKNYELYMKAEQLLIGAATTGNLQMENMKIVCEHFGEDLDEQRLKNQLSVLSDIIDSPSPSLRVIHQDILTLNTTSSLFSEVLKLLKLLFVLPASTASAERSFSSLRRLKTYLRSSMTAQRLNHVLLLHVHKDITEQLDLCMIAKEFVCRNDRRKGVFGLFS